jgi:hypothetical protein
MALHFDNSQITREHDRKLNPIGGRNEIWFRSRSGKRIRVQFQEVGHGRHPSRFQWIKPERPPSGNSTHASDLAHGGRYINWL